MQVSHFTDVHRRHQELCEAGGRHGEADPGPEPERGRSLPATQSGHQEEEEELFKEAQFCLHAVFPQGHSGWRERDQSRLGDSCGSINIYFGFHFYLSCFLRRILMVLVSPQLTADFLLLYRSIILSAAQL